MMNLRSPFFIALFIVLLGGSLRVAAGESPAKPGSMAAESMGGLYVGMSSVTALRLLAAKPVLSKKEMSEMTGSMYQSADFPGLGIRLLLESDDDTSPQMVTSIVVKAPSKLSTKKGIHIGSTEAEVIAVYNAEHAERSNDSVVADFADGYGIFTIKDGKVSEINMSLPSEEG